MKQKLILPALLFLCTANVFSQDIYPKIKPSLLGLNYTLVDYNSPRLIKSTSLKDVVKQGNIFNPVKQAAAFTVSYWRGITNLLDFSGKYNGIIYDFARHNDPARAKHPNEFGSELEGALNLRFLSDDHFFQPFVTAGIGAGYYTNKFGGYVPLGVGFQFNVQSRLYFFLQTQYRLTLSKDVFPDNLLHSIGGAIRLSAPKKKAPAPLPVVEITDRDNDGTPDSMDACPDIAGLSSLHGCPDKDGDGIADNDDKCPDIAGIAKYNGCPIPDTDGDGVNDELDKCPNQAGVARYNGCPVPDIDNDGVNDEDDKCPNVPGPASNFGCPEIKQAIIEKINLAAKNIFFATGSATLLAKSYPSLNNVVKILTDNPGFKVSVEGHTDTTGTAAKNLVLSENRAASVKAWLVSKGVEAGRITSAGFGSDKPIAPNKTAAGRAKNRRVEMKLRNY